MRITADTNILVRAIVADDAKQARLAQDALGKADCVAAPTPVLCEFVWVLARGYGLPSADIADAIRRLVATAKVEADRPAIEAGLSAMARGGDFADGVIAFEGAKLGGETFVSFDKEAVALLKADGRKALLLS
ncbi:type II toxin-antitoxin system VapC family toxin [Terricaulis sp.]|uniref:type II toxin-antitoxin system VapC family toxin n=1 Tax=Terricaulis sp. TaxID=2768686 RepID=UPI0037841025